MVDGVSSSTSATGTTSTSSSSSTGTSSLGKDDFLQLLVTQLENQDPLEPMDNTEFVSQLAQFSSLEGITNLNTTMEGVVSSLSSMEAYASTDLIGKFVKSEGTDLLYSGAAVNFGFSLDSAASTSTVTIKDANGNTVNRMDLGALSSGTYDLTWDGKDSSGNTAAGSYTFAVDAKDSSGSSLPASTYTVGAVSSVVFGSSGTTLTVDGKTISKSDIQAIY